MNSALAYPLSLKGTALMYPFGLRVCEGFIQEVCRKTSFFTFKMIMQSLPAYGA